MEKRLEWWNKKIEKYATKKWVDIPSMFAKFALGYFPKTGKVLELGD